MDAIDEVVEVIEEIEEQPLPLLRPEVFISTMAGIGFFPKGPGTVGALVVTIGLMTTGTLVYAPVLLVLTTLVGTWASDRYMRRSGTHDPGEIVIDEAAGILAAFVAIMVLDRFLGPFAAAPFGLPDITGPIIVFGLFRLFDISKPWPVGKIDRDFHGAFGVMLDDMVAGVMAALAWALMMLVF